MKFRVSITQQFFIFLFLVSLAPLLLISGLFYQDIETKFNERINNLLTFGMLIAKDGLKNDLDTLMVSTQQAATFSLGHAIRQYGQSSDTTILASTMHRLQRLHKLETVMLFGPDGKLALETNPIRYDSDQVLIQKGLQGQSTCTIDQLHNPRHQQTGLSYICTAPVLDKAHPEKPAGVLLTSFSMDRNFSLKNVLKIFPQLDIRIFLKTPDHDRVLSTSTAEMNVLNQLGEKPQLEKLPANDYVLFKELFNHEVYRSLAFPLSNSQNQLVGYIVVSSSEDDFGALKQRNILYITGYLVFVLLFILLAAYGFKRSIITPVNELANASEKVSQGDLGLRVRDTYRHEKIRKLMSNFNKMLSQLEEDNLLKDTFVSTLAHDLRTPLFAQKRVIEAIEKIKKHDHNADLNEMLAAIQKGNTQLIDMVNKLLEAYQYEAGRITLYPETLDLHQLVQECLNDIAPLAQAKQIVLQNQVETGFKLVADREQLKRVFQNLLGNAVANIQAQRSVTITAQEAGGLVHLMVADNGPGISLDIQPHLFQRYFTGHAKQTIGTGLGLFICRMIVELHGGNISVQSAPGEGTTFRIVLPTQGTNT